MSRLLALTDDTNVVILHGRVYKLHLDEPGADAEAFPAGEDVVERIFRKQDECMELSEGMNWLLDHGFEMSHVSNDRPRFSWVGAIVPGYSLLYVDVFLEHRSVSGGPLVPYQWVASNNDARFYGNTPKSALARLVSHYSAKSGAQPEGGAE